MPYSSNGSFLSTLAIGAVVLAGAIYGVHKFQVSSRMDSAVRVQMERGYVEKGARRHWGKAGYLLAMQAGEGERQFVSGMLDEAGATVSKHFVERDKDVPMAYDLGMQFQKARQLEISVIEDVADTVAQRHIDLSDAMRRLTRKYGTHGKNPSREPGRIAVGQLFLSEVLNNLDRDVLESGIVDPNLKANLEVFRTKDSWTERTLADIDPEDVAEVRNIVRSVAMRDPILRAQVMDVISGRAPLTEYEVRDEAALARADERYVGKKSQYEAIVDPFASLGIHDENLIAETSSKLGL